MYDGVAVWLVFTGRIIYRSSYLPALAEYSLSETRYRRPYVFISCEDFRFSPSSKMVAAEWYPDETVAIRAESGSSFIATSSTLRSHHNTNSSQPSMASDTACKPRSGPTAVVAWKCIPGVSNSDLSKFDVPVQSVRCSLYTASTVCVDCSRMHPVAKNANWCAEAGFFYSKESIFSRIFQFTTLTVTRAVCNGDL